MPPADPAAAAATPDASDRAVLAAARPVDAATLAVIAAGGGLGALARYALALAWPPAPGRIPWATLTANVSGCAAIGALLVLVEARRSPRLLRPFLAVGVLGGYTTFSTYALEVRRLLESGAVTAAAVYLAGTVVAGLAAVALGAAAARRITGRADRTGKGART